MPGDVDLEIRRATLENCAQIRGLAVSIDVLRAFKTAGYLFHYGAADVILVGELEEAFTLKAANPSFLLLGEVGGIKVPEFDLGNSPSLLNPAQINGKTVVQRTTAGTQGVVRSVHASPILAAALTNISATVRYIQHLNPSRVTLIETGIFPGGFGDEDTACADGIESLLKGHAFNFGQLEQRVVRAENAKKYTGTEPSFPPEDPVLAAQVDKFDFAMRVETVNGLKHLRRISI